MQRLKRIASTAAGVLLLAVAAIASYSISYGFYVDHYWMPLEKYGHLDPLRWQDVVFIVFFWLVMFAFFYLSYRLLRFGIRKSAAAIPPTPHDAP
jgi:hypothetical protein